MLLLRQCLIDFIPIEVEVKEGLVVSAFPVEIARVVLKLLQLVDLLVGDVLTAVDHHLRQHLVHQSLLVLSRVCHDKVLNLFLFSGVKGADEGEARDKHSSILLSLELLLSQFNLLGGGTLTACFALSLHKNKY